MEAVVVLCWNLTVTPASGWQFSCDSDACYCDPCYRALRFRNSTSPASVGMVAARCLKPNLPLGPTRACAIA